MSPLKSPSARTVQAERTRQEILATAQRLFGERGYDATSLQMIADEMGLTKAAVYYHFPAKYDILHEAMLPGINRVKALLDKAAEMRGRRARIECIINGFVDFLVDHRDYAVLAARDPAAKRNRADGEANELRRRGLTLMFGEHPTAADRLAYSAVFWIPESLPELTDVSDEDLRDALRTTMLRILKVPPPGRPLSSRSSGPRG